MDLFSNAVLHPRMLTVHAGPARLFERNAEKLSVRRFFPFLLLWLLVLLSKLTTPNRQENIEKESLLNKCAQ